MLSLLGVVVAVGAAASIYSNEEPEYIQSAKSRVGSYLTSDYGRVECNSTQVSEDRWELGCTNKARGKTFQFAVYPSEQAPYGSLVRFISKRLMMMPARVQSRG